MVIVCTSLYLVPISERKIDSIDPMTFKKTHKVVVIRESIDFSSSQMIEVSAQLGERQTLVAFVFSVCYFHH